MELVSISGRHRPAAFVVGRVGREREGGGGFGVG